jgi:hypothetical protein
VTNRFAIFNMIVCHLQFRFVMSETQFESSGTVLLFADMHALRQVSVVERYIGRLIPAPNMSSLKS